MFDKTLAQLYAAPDGTAFKEPTMKGYLAVIGHISGSTLTAVSNRLSSSYTGDLSFSDAFTGSPQVMVWQPRDADAKAYAFLIHQLSQERYAVTGGQLQNYTALQLKYDLGGKLSLLPNASGNAVESNMALTGELLGLLLSPAKWTQGILDDFNAARAETGRVW